MNVQLLFDQVFALAKASIPFLGGSALNTIERAVTIPEAKVRQMMGNAPEADKVEAVRLARVQADALSDFAVFVASRGKIQAD